MFCCSAIPASTLESKHRAVKAIADDLVVKFPEIKLRLQLCMGFLSQFQDFQLTKFVGKRLRQPHLSRVFDKPYRIDCSSLAKYARVEQSGQWLKSNK